MGIGVELKIDGQTPVVVRTLPRGPAEAAHLLAGDRILAIGDQGTDGLGLGNVVMRLRGKPGSQAVLKVMRGKQLLTVLVRRESLNKQANQYGER